MIRNVGWTVAGLIVLTVLYFALWPVPIDPVAWAAPPNHGYTGPFAPNDRLKSIETLAIGDNRGPEDIAIAADGRIYTSTREGRIVRLRPDGSHPENWAETGGRPLGLDFDNDGNLIVAGAFRGLLSVAPEGTVTELATVADGVPIRYANDVDVTADGRVYFSDSSVKFGAQQPGGGTYEASLLDIMEHGGHGRLLFFDPRTRRTTRVLDGLNFPNGVAVSSDQTYLLVNETGSYRVLREWIDGAKKHQHEPLIEALPAFPDNVTTGLNGRFWVALVAPRNRLVDNLSGSPFLRKVIQRMPGFLRPKAAAYGYIIAIDGAGNVVENLQDPQGTYPLNTSVNETNDYLYVGSLRATALGRFRKTAAGL